MPDQSTHPADRVARLAVAIGSALTYVGTETARARSTGLAQELSETRDLLEQTRARGTTLIEIAYHLGRRHANEDVAVPDDLVGAVADELHHQGDKPAAAAAADEEAPAAAADEEAPHQVDDPAGVDRRRVSLWQLTTGRAAR